jgi:hypothetical protein
VIFAAFRARFGPRRKDAARPIRGLEVADGHERLFNFRQLLKGILS